MQIRDIFYTSLGQLQIFRIVGFSDKSNQKRLKMFIENHHTCNYKRVRKLIWLTACEWVVFIYRNNTFNEISYTVLSKHSKHMSSKIMHL